MKSKKSHEEWKKLVTDFNESGLSMTAFCKNTDLKASTFIYWIKMFNQPINKVSKLVKLPIKQLSKISSIQIAIDQIKLEIPGNMSADKISKLIVAIREVI